MFRNQYDTDVTTWSPQGRLHQVGTAQAGRRGLCAGPTLLFSLQVEYAMEAVKQGSACVGLKSDTHVVLAALKRAPSELSSYQRKVFKIDDHMGIAISGLTADGRILCRYMRNECINHRFVFDAAMPVGRLVRQIADKAQVSTHRSWKRPYGVGLLVAGVDEGGAHLYQTCPSGNMYDYKAMAIGARSQAAKTYLVRVPASPGRYARSHPSLPEALPLHCPPPRQEKTFETYPKASLDELVLHGLRALEASSQDAGLDRKNCTIAIVGRDLPFTVLEDEALEPYLAQIKRQEDGADQAAAGQPEAAGDGDQQMQD